MSEKIRQVPDEIQLQVADDEGMIDRTKVEHEIQSQAFSMEEGVGYELVQIQTAEWEGMISAKDSR